MMLGGLGRNRKPAGASNSLLTSLISYWPMEEASGDAIDAHGSNDLTDTNTVGSAAGIISNARDFEASNTEYFTIADNTDLSAGDIDFTIQIWAHAETLASFPVLVRKGGFESDPEYVLFYNTTASRMVFGTASTGNGINYTEVAANNFGAMSTSTWYCVHAWHDSVNNQLGIAINAGTPNTLSYSVGVYDGPGAFELGASSPQALYWDGLLDEAAFWKRVLTSDERTDLYNSGAGRPYSYFA